MAKHTNSSLKSGFAEAIDASHLSNVQNNTDEQGDRRIYAPYEVVNIILRRNELMLRIHQSLAPVLAGVLEASLVLINEELSAIRPQDVDRNLKLPGTE